MEIFVGNLDENITENQLKEFFKGFDRRASFKLVHLQEELPDGKEKMYVYGLVTIESERLARKAIKKLNYRKINSKPAVVREFHHRASQNDKRALNWRLKDWQKEERRSKDRRKNRKVVKSYDEFEVTAMEGFSRKYN